MSDFCYLANVKLLLVATNGLDSTFQGEHGAEQVYEGRKLFFCLWWFLGTVSLARILLTQNKDLEL